jgi:hypothetical protein
VNCFAAATTWTPDFGREPLLLVLKFQLNAGHPPIAFAELLA